jgi:hypothetical protein
VKMVVFVGSLNYVELNHVKPKEVSAMLTATKPAIEHKLKRFVRTACTLDDIG